MPSRATAFFSLLFLFSEIEAHGQAQITEHEIKNVYQIQAPSGAKGSPFALQVDGKYYLVTARHMVNGLKADGSAESVKIRAAGELLFRP
jgi:hypothetical protein